MSERCNWCGTEIRDTRYQAEAKLERAAFRAEEALHDLQSLNIVQGNLRLDPLVFEAHTQARLQEREEAQQTFAERGQASADLPFSDSDDETKERFEHLEL